MATFEIDSSKLNKLVKIAEKYPAISEKHIATLIARVFTRAQKGVNENAPVGVTGHLRDNWESVIGRFSGSFKSKQNYSGAIEQGTQPHFVSANALKEWASKRGLNPYAVAKSIQKKGTRANPFFRKSLDSLNKDIDKDFQEAIDNIAKDIASIN